MRKHGFRALAAAAFSCVWLFDGLLAGQTKATWESVRPRDRVAGRIDEAVRVRLSGNRHPLARAEFDVGRAATDERMERMTLSLLPDDAQGAALDALLEAQQNRNSTMYQSWLTPEEFGARFGVSQNDLVRIVDWLESNGFTVEAPPAGGRWLVFSGTVGQVESTFHTEIREYRIAGKSTTRTPGTRRFREPWRRWWAAWFRSMISRHSLST